MKWEITGFCGEVMKTVLVMLFIIAVLLILFVSTKLSLTAYVAWMVENNFAQPSDRDMQRLIGWCAKKYIQDLFGKS